jgi:hypothetical protein
MGRKLSKGYFFALALVDSAIYSTANAEVTTSLESIHHHVYGSDSLTRDPATGLDWLDWSLTTDRAVSEVATQLGPGGEFAGFRYATKEEVITLYHHAGFTALDAFSVGTPADFDAAANFVGLFGLTREFHNSQVDLFQSRAFLGPGSYPLPSFHVEVLVWYDQRGETGFAGANGGLVDPVGIGDGPSEMTGHALVRAVPEPSGPVLLLWATFGLLHSMRARIHASGARARAS